MSHSKAPARYSAVAMGFHWSIATLILIDFCCGVSFGRFDPDDALYWPAAYAMHMSIGMIIMMLSVGCVSWRVMHRYPPLPRDMSVVSRLLAKSAHVLLYGFILIVPFTGWAVLSVRRKPPALFAGLSWPNLGFLSSMGHAQRSYLHDQFLASHIYLAYLGICLVGAHVVAALYHHFWRRDEILRRMLPGGKSPARIGGAGGGDTANSV